MKSTSLASGLAFAAIVALVAPQIEAAPFLGLEAISGGANATTTGAGPLILNQAIGNFTVNIDTASIVANPLAFLMTANDIASAQGGSITIIGSAQNLDNPNGATSFLSQFSGTFLGNVTDFNLKTYYNADNSLFGTDTLLSDLPSGLTSPFANSGTAAQNTTVPFSVTEVLVIVLDGRGQVGATGQIDGTACIPGTPGCVVNPPALPEPTSMALLGTSLLGMGAILRRRNRRNRK